MSVAKIFNLLKQERTQHAVYKYILKIEKLSLCFLIYKTWYIGWKVLGWISRTHFFVHSTWIFFQIEVLDFSALSHIEAKIPLFKLCVKLWMICFEQMFERPNSQEVTTFSRKRLHFYIIRKNFNVFPSFLMLRHCIFRSLLGYENLGNTSSLITKRMTFLQCIRHMESV